MIGSRISAPLARSSSERIEYTHPLSARYTKGEKREMVGRAVFSPSSSARRAEAPGASSVRPRSRSTTASDATSSGRTTRWNEIPEAFAAVSSEYRPSVPTVNTTANSTATGRTSEIVSGRKNRYEYATRSFGIPRPRYVSSLSVRSMTMTRKGNPNAANRHTLAHSRST